MTSQLPLPAGWAIAHLSTTLDPEDELDRLNKHKVEAKAEIRVALDRLAGLHHLDPGEVGRAVQGYADDMINDACYELERDLTFQIEQRDTI